DSDKPMKRDTIFRLASLTKPILATATMMLVEDGTLALDEPIDRLLPELADRRVLRRIDGPLDDTVAANRPITVRDLLTFRMGYGMLIEPTATPPFDPPFPIVQAANELQLVMGPPDPACGSARRSSRRARLARARRSTPARHSRACCSIRACMVMSGSCRSGRSR